MLFGIDIDTTGLTPAGQEKIRVEFTGLSFALKLCAPCIGRLFHLLSGFDLPHDSPVNACGTRRQPESTRRDQ